MRLIDIVGSKETVYFIPYVIKNRRKTYYYKAILSYPEKSSNNIVSCTKIIEEDYFDYYGLHGEVLLRENIDVELVDIGLEWESSRLKVVYTKNNKKILWEDGKWLI